MRPALSVTRWLGPTGLTIVALAATAWLLWPRPPAPGVIPPELAADVAAHQQQAAVDSVELARLAAAHDSAVARAARRQLADSLRLAHARALGRQADSLAAVARAAATAQDSAVAWQAAYLERTAERDTLLATVASKEATIADVDAARVLALTRAAIQQARAEHAEARWARALAEVQRREPPCTIGPVPCPSRTLVAALAFAGGVATGL